MLKDGRARVDAGPKTTPKKGESHRILIPVSIRFVLMGSFHTNSTWFVFLKGVRTCSWPLHQQTVMERVTALIGSRYPISRTLSVRPSRRLCLSWIMQIKPQHMLFLSMVSLLALLNASRFREDWRFVYCISVIWLFFSSEEKGGKKKKKKQKLLFSTSMVHTK